MLPPQDLTCPDPSGCPVLDTLPVVPGVALPAGTPMFRAYRTRWGYDEFNPGFGDSRFVPFDSLGSRRRVPSLYLAGNEVGALLETVFHDVHHQASRHIFETDLREHALAHVRIPRELWLADLRDSVLTDLGVSRDGLVATSSEHYPCTRRVARDLHNRAVGGRPTHGLLWHSRQAELLGRDPVEVCVVFGDRYAPGRGGWPLTGPGARNLFEGPGRLLVDELANDLDAVVHPLE